MRTPVILVAGQTMTDEVVDELLREPGTLVVRHRFDGHVVRRGVMSWLNGDVVTAEQPLELAHRCVACTIRDDLLILLRRLHRRGDVHRIVVQLEPWLEPEPICWAIRHVRVSPGSGFIDGTAGRDVVIAGVVTCVDPLAWLEQALGDTELPDGRTVAQVVIAQCEFADLLVCPQPIGALGAVLARLNARALMALDAGAVRTALQHLPTGARRGSDDDPHSSLLDGQPPLEASGPVALLEFRAQRPFHPQRLHVAVDTLLDGVVRTRGRVWLAGNQAEMMWLESAGGGLRVSAGGRWLAAMTPSELAYADPERRALAAAFWDDEHGDRHSSITVLVCGADADVIGAALESALLTDAEMRCPELWPAFEDPFGDWHEDPCGEPAGTSTGTVEMIEGDESPS